MLQDLFDNLGNESAIYTQSISYKRESVFAKNKNDDYLDRFLSKNLNYSNFYKTEPINNLAQESAYSTSAIGPINGTTVDINVIAQKEVTIIDYNQEFVEIEIENHRSVFKACLFSSYDISFGKNFLYQICVDDEGFRYEKFTPSHKETSKVYMSKINNYLSQF